MALAAVTTALTDEEKHKIDFIAFDFDQNGFIDASEVRKQYDDKVKQQDVSAFFIAADKNEDGLIDLDEYVHASLRQDSGELDLNDYKLN
jgi:Ca2+-binding EF-hand superfamily protein